MTATFDDTNRLRTRPRRAAVALGAALATLALSAGVANAQSGGTASPGSVPPSTAPAPSSAGSGTVFPIPGPHTYGDGFGAARGGRSHQGVDLFASCGSPLVAVAQGKVMIKGTHPAAGNYLVIRSKKPFPRDYVYMHLQAPAPLLKKQKVVPGQAVGNVGETGNASGCHLHFEIWKGKWYRGGRALDPLPTLQAWDAYS